jgi:hypothetical protein
MERYTPLDQADDEIGKEPLISHIKVEPRRLDSSYIWFATGFIAAVMMAFVFALSYTVINKRVTPPGLIPDCKLTPNVDMHGSYDGTPQFPLLMSNLNPIWNFPT